MKVAVPPGNNTHDENLVAEVRLSMVSGVGPRLRFLLISAFGSAQQALRASTADLTRVQGIGAKLAEKITRAHELDPIGQIELAERAGGSIVLLGSPGYPPLLKEISDSPAVLFTRGDFLPSDDRAVAIVGSRHPTNYGKQAARRLAAGLAKVGVTVVSGLARGIDAAAHAAALEAGGRTIAVLAGGLERLYPPEHAGLAEAVAQCGCVLTESPPGMPPLAGSFPQRNRIISGLSLGSVVVEASDRSGALITCKHAAEQGREVFAVPGPIDSRLSRGCHGLIRDGAKLVQDVDDILEELPPSPEPIDRSPTAAESAAPVTPPPPAIVAADLNDVERRVLGAIDAEPTSVDSIVENSGLPVHRVLATISVLEVRGVVRRISGTLVCRP